MSSFLNDFQCGFQSRDINQHHLPFAAWADGAAILASPTLGYDLRNPRGKLLLGALNGLLICLEDARH